MPAQSSGRFTTTATAVAAVIAASAVYLLFAPPIIGVADQGDYDRILARVGLQPTDPSQADANSWWQVDLGAPLNVNSIIIWNRTDCCTERLSDYWVFLSDAPLAANETPEQLCNRNDIWAMHETAAPDPSVTIPVVKHGRYVRVQLGRRAYLSLAEVQVLGSSSNGKQNLALHKEATQSSSFRGVDAGRALDGNTDGDFFHGSVTHTGDDKCGYHCFVNRIWTAVPADRTLPLFSTAEIPPLIAKELSKTALLDIRSVALVYVLLLLFTALTIISSCRSLPAFPRWIIASGLVLISTDSEYTAYFNSFYGEAAAFVGALAFVAASITAILKDSRFWRHMIAIVLAAAFLIGSKAQNAVLAPIAAGWIIWFFWRGKRSQRYVSTFAGFALMCFGGFVLQRAPAPESNLFNAIYDRVLPNSPDSLTALAELGLPAETVTWKGKQYWEVRDHGHPLFPGNSSRLKLLVFYLRHPIIDLRMAREALTLNNDVPYIGNFEKEAGRPAGARTSAFTAYDRLRARLASIWFVFPVLAANVAMMIRVRNRIASLVAVLAIMAFVAFLLGAFYDNEPRKHLLTFNVLFDVVLFADLAIVSTVLSAARRRTLH
jgi:hypothetical protein